MDESVPLQPLQYDTMFGALQLAQQANRTTVNEEDRAANAPEVVVSGFPEVRCRLRLLDALLDVLNLVGPA